MKSFKLICFLSCLITLRSFALEIEMPAETAKYQSSDLPGYQLVQKNCIVCHSADYVLNQPPNSSRRYWTATVQKMRNVFGAPIAEEEIAGMVDYLVKYYGNEKLSAGSVKMQ